MPRRNLEDRKSGQEKLGGDTTIESNSAECPPFQARDDSGMMIEQAVDRFINRLSLANSIPADVSDVQRQGHERQPVALSPIKSLGTQSELSSLELESRAKLTSAAESTTAEHAIYDHLQRLSSSASSQEVTDRRDESDERKSPLPYNMDEAIDRVLRPNSRTHLRIASASRTTTTLPKPNVQITLAVPDSFGASHGTSNS